MEEWVLGFTGQAQRSKAAGMVEISYQSWGAPTGRCTLGEDIFNILYNSTMRDTGEYGVEGAVGFTGTRQELLAVINQVRANFSLAELEACLDLFTEPPPNPAQRPSSGGASNLGYGRPGHLGGIQNMPVPRPPSESFTYGHGYTTYQRPFFIVNNVKEYEPSEYLKANSVQDLFAVIYDNLLKGWAEWSKVFDGGLTPKFWNNYPNQAKR
ncbi:uncharacterized protein [Halyomorpha halys]|uniref:uncharacterized protein isoform X2 n=1 Tax=Halyomorpha halys TaxID=286706 RepID=UPI0034D2C391